MTPPVFCLLAGPNGAGKSTLLSGGRSFVSETVFSYPSKSQIMADTWVAGFRTVLLVVCVDNVQQLVRRVAQVISNKLPVWAASVLDR